MGSFQPAAWQVRRARVATEQWNEEHLERVVPWEWVEEALLAGRCWKEFAGHDPEQSERARLRYNEFARKLPAGLRAEIWPQEWRSAADDFTG